MPLLLIVGKGPCWSEDVAAFRRFGVPHDVLGVNQAALWLDDAPRYAYSYHPMLMADVKRQRPGVTTISQMPSEGVDIHHRLRGETGGSSSFLACRVALERLGYARVVLAGVPLSGDYFPLFVPQWLAGRDYVTGKVRSMSGATAAMLGSPDEQWMEGR